MDAVQLYITIAGLSYFYFSNAATLGTVFSRNLLRASARKERLKHVMDVVIDYLKQPRAAKKRKS